MRTVTFASEMLMLTASGKTDKDIVTVNSKQSTDNLRTHIRG